MTGDEGTFERKGGLVQSCEKGRQEKPPNFKKRAALPKKGKREVRDYTKTGSTLGRKNGQSKLFSWLVASGPAFGGELLIVENQVRKKKDHRLRTFVLK